MQKSFFHKIEKAVFAAVGVLLAVVLILSAKEHNAVNMSRPDSDYTVVEDVSYEKIEKEDAPTGIINESALHLARSFTPIRWPSFSTIIMWKFIWQRNVCTV